MKNKLMAVIVAFFSMFLLMGLMTVEISAQKPESIKSTRAEKGRGDADPNIKQGETTNSAKSKIETPPAKGGTTRGGGGCRVEFDNSTAWYIKVYVDGIFRGTMGPWDDSYVYVIPGITKVYARAEFDDGSYRYWGPKSYDCGPGESINFRMLP